MHYAKTILQLLSGYRKNYLIPKHGKIFDSELIIIIIIIIIIMPKLFIDACTEAMLACRGAHVRDF